MRSLFSGKNVNYTWSINNNYNGVPDTVVHYAEQPSAPYSLMNYKTANFTISNNLLVTNNLLFAVKDLAPNVHIIKLGTMGEYGTPNIDIEEGLLDQHEGSVKVGELLKKLYVDSALRKGEKIDKSNPTEVKVFKESKDISWKQYKNMNSE